MNTKTTPKFDSIETVTVPGMKYGGRFIRVNHFTLPDGRKGQWESTLTEHGHCVLMAGITPEGKLILITIYRPAIEDYAIELPGGGKEGGEDVLEGAQREFREETGYLGDTPALLAQGCMWSARTNERYSIFYSTNCKKVQETEQDPVEKYFGLEVIEKYPKDIITEILNGARTYSDEISQAILLLATKGIISLK